MLISARARGYLCNHIMSVFSGSLFMKSRKREKGERGSELYMEQGQLCKHIECVEGKGFFCKKKSSQFLHNKMKRKWFIQSLWTPFSLWNYFISDQSDLVLIALFSPDYYPILFPLALCPSEASFERSYQPFRWQLFRYSNIQLLEFSRVMFKLSW